MRGAPALSERFAPSSQGAAATAAPFRVAASAFPPGLACSLADPSARRRVDAAGLHGELRDRELREAEPACNEIGELLGGAALAVDGVVGPRTRAALAAARGTRDRREGRVGIIGTSVHV